MHKEKKAFSQVCFFKNMQFWAKARDKTPDFFLWVLTGPSGILTQVQLDLNLLRSPRDYVEAI